MLANAERKLPKYGSPQWKRLMANRALKAAMNVQQMGIAAPGDIMTIRYGKEAGILEKLNSISGQREYLGGQLSQMKYAEGGMIEDENMEMPVGDMSLLAPMGEAESEFVGESEPSNFLPLIDILGEEKFTELEQAMMDYPVVEEVAEMAMYTSDGEVDGMGGPKEDLVPARLSDGEFVFSKEAVDVIGLDTLERMHDEAKAEAAMSI